MPLAGPGVQPISRLPPGTAASLGQQGTRGSRCLVANSADRPSSHSLPGSDPPRAPCPMPRTPLYHRTPAHLLPPRSYSVELPNPRTVEHPNRSFSRSPSRPAPRARGSVDQPPSPALNRSRCRRGTSWGQVGASGPVSCEILNFPFLNLRLTSGGPRVTAAAPAPRPVEPAHLCGGECTRRASALRGGAGVRRRFGALAKPSHLTC
jgi:hypothetical protein